MAVTFMPSIEKLIDSSSTNKDDVHVILEPDTNKYIYLPLQRLFTPPTVRISQATEGAGCQWNKMQITSSNKNAVLQILKTEDTAAPPPPLPFTPEQIHLPLEMIFKIGESLEYTDYRNFLQALWPNNDVNDIDPRRLWKMTTHQFTTTFCNGKKLRVEYNFDLWREEDEQILINVNDVLSLFNGGFPRSACEFVSISKLADFARTSVHLDSCSYYQYASCECYLQDDGEPMTHRPFVKPNVSDCEHGHFHHYCSDHLADWLRIFLTTSVLFRETGKCRDEKTYRAFFIILLYISYVQDANVEDLPTADVLQ